MNNQNINLKDITLVPILDSVYRTKISDQEYFSQKYANYISNSKLKLINPLENGSPIKFKNGFTNEKTVSLYLGSMIHLGVLQPDEFKLGPDINKPGAKLGLVIDRIYDLRKNNLSIHSCILQSCQELHYYELSLSPLRIRNIIKLGLEYYLKRKLLKDESLILISGKDRDIILTCINNINLNRKVQNTLYPTDLFGDKIPSYNEDTFFINLKGKYKDKECVLKLKMKADNWNIDVDNKIITLNDLKTTSHGINNFMEHSFNNFHYYRQCAMYIWILLQYAKKEYGYNKKEWTVKCNILTVETTFNYKTEVFPISNNIIQEGRKEFCKLLKMVAYCEMNGYSDDIIFI